MARNYDDDFLAYLYDKIADYDPTFITERRANRYSRSYYSYHNIKITVTKDHLTNSISAISITKM